MSIGRGNVGRIARHSAPANQPGASRGAFRRIDQATQEMSKFGVASAHAELVSPGLI
jgi:hypothetical protein